MASATAAALVLGGSVGAQAAERHPVASHVGAASLSETATSAQTQRPTLSEPADAGRQDPLAASEFELGFNVRDLIYVILTHHEQEVIIAAFATGSASAICGRLGRFCTGPVTKFVYEQVFSHLLTPCPDRWKFDILKPSRSHCL